MTYLWYMYYGCSIPFTIHPGDVSVYGLTERAMIALKFGLRGVV